VLCMLQAKHVFEKKKDYLYNLMKYLKYPFFRGFIVSQNEKQDRNKSYWDFSLFWSNFSLSVSRF